MRKIACVLLLVFLLQMTPMLALASQDQDIHTFKEDIAAINVMSFKYAEIGQSLIFSDGPRSFNVDDLILRSNEGFFLYLYDLIYQEEAQFMTNPKTDVETTDIYYLYDMAEERRLHINRLVSDGYLTEDDLLNIEFTKVGIAKVLYNIYKDLLPYQGSVSFTDTDNIAVLWAAERGLPYFLNPSGYQIYPNQNMQEFGQYLDCLRYIALYFPNPKTGEYNELMDSNPEANIKHPYTDAVISHDKAGQIIVQIRQEIKKPRLGYWVRDVLNNPKMEKTVNTYLKDKSNAKLKIIHQDLKEKFNLLQYQDDPLYIKYMFKLFN